MGVWNIDTLDLSTSALCGVGNNNAARRLLFLVDLMRELALKTLDYSSPNH
jgi:hypothetical protein